MSSLSAAVPSPRLRDYLPLLANLIRRDLALKYKGSVLGFAWSLANPLLVLGAYALAFQHVLRVSIPDFPLFFFVAYLPWSFFGSALMGATASIPNNESLVGSVAFRSEVLPLAAVATQAVEMILAGAVLVPILALAARPLSAAVLLVPAIVSLHVALTGGIGLLLAALHVRYRDTLHLVQVGLTIAFWATPIVYPLTMAPAHLRSWLWCNPMTWYVEAYRSVLFSGVAPPVPVLAGLAVWSALALGTGLAAYRRLAPGMAEHV